MRLANGLLWTIPITLDVSKEQVEESKIEPTKRIALLDPRDYVPLAILTVEDVYRPDKSKEAALVYGADDSAHPAVHYLHNIAKEFNVGGSLEAVQSPSHYDYVANRCKYTDSFREKRGPMMGIRGIDITKHVYRHSYRTSCSFQEASMDPCCCLPNP